MYGEHQYVVNTLLQFIGHPVPHPVPYLAHNVPILQSPIVSSKAIGKNLVDKEKTREH